MSLSTKSSTANVAVIVLLQVALLLPTQAQAILPVCTRAMMTVEDLWRALKIEIGATDFEKAKSDSKGPNEGRTSQQNDRAKFEYNRIKDYMDNKKARIADAIRLLQTTRGRLENHQDEVIRRDLYLLSIILESGHLPDIHQDIFPVFTKVHDAFNHFQEHRKERNDLKEADGTLQKSREGSDRRLALLMDSDVKTIGKHFHEFMTLRIFLTMSILESKIPDIQEVVNTGYMLVYEGKINPVSDSVAATVRELIDQLASGSVPAKAKKNESEEAQHVRQKVLATIRLLNILGVDRETLVKDLEYVATSNSESGLLLNKQNLNATMALDGMALEALEMANAAGSESFPAPTAATQERSIQPRTASPLQGPRAPSLAEVNAVYSSSYRAKMAALQERLKSELRNMGRALVARVGQYVAKNVVANISNPHLRALVEFGTMVSYDQYLWSTFLPYIAQVEISGSSGEAKLSALIRALDSTNENKQHFLTMYARLFEVSASWSKMRDEVKKRSDDGDQRMTALLKMMVKADTQAAKDGVISVRYKRDWFWQATKDMTAAGAYYFGGPVAIDQIKSLIHSVSSLFP